MAEGAGTFWSEMRRVNARTMEGRWSGLKPLVPTHFCFFASGSAEVKQSPIRRCKPSTKPRGGRPLPAPPAGKGGGKWGGCGFASRDRLCRGLVVVVVAIVPIAAVVPIVGAIASTLRRPIPVMPLASALMAAAFAFSATLASASFLRSLSVSASSSSSRRDSLFLSLAQVADCAAACAARVLSSPTSHRPSFTVHRFEPRADVLCLSIRQ
mmetsp:Transcript_44655/g.90217  ORF Transcript_44655/g.90217 Transcript_44655/m.90217 type:complete len:211 (-) Transcript_44655:781-1413(-)